MTFTAKAKKLNEGEPLQFLQLKKKKAAVHKEGGVYFSRLYKEKKTP